MQLKAQRKAWMDKIELISSTPRTNQLNSLILMHWTAKPVLPIFLERLVFYASMVQINSTSKPMELSPERNLCHLVCLGCYLHLCHCHRQRICLCHCLNHIYYVLTSSTSRPMELSPRRNFWRQSRNLCFFLPSFLPIKQ